MENVDVMGFVSAIKLLQVTFTLDIAVSAILIMTNASSQPARSVLYNRYRYVCTYIIPSLPLHGYQK